MTAWAADAEGHCDFNRDGAIDDKDAAIWNANAQVFYLRFTRDLPSFYRQFDLNKDGIINILDWTIMQDMLAGYDWFHQNRLGVYVPPWQRVVAGALAMTVVAGMGGILVKEALN